MPDAQNTFSYETEGEMGSLRAVLVVNCPDCGASNRFTAEDELADRLVCRCKKRFALNPKGDSLADHQRSLDAINREVQDLSDTFRKFSL